ncbi:uncharacterized protein LOC120943709 isoform X1 [Rana temporaria]|uniref:uncharacterized protein LOC120943709 isoform X1 n=1 Tax=Rana temporaria TaxID=8407 RepID=UPI001AAD3818|nr:uncharacterized protein LOC120943709 isoform X1 [Rana temporaria]
MESLFKKLLEKAGSEGGEEWLKRCLTMGDIVPEEQTAGVETGAGFMLPTEQQGESASASEEPPVRARRSQPPERTREALPTEEEERRRGMGEEEDGGGVPASVRRSGRQKRNLSQSPARGKARGGRAAQPSASVGRGRPLPPRPPIQQQVPLRGQEQQVLPVRLEPAASMQRGEPGPAVNAQPQAVDGPFSSAASGGGCGRDALPGIFVGPNLDIVSRAIQGSVAPKTWLCYAASWKSWLSFAEDLGVSDGRPSEGSLLAFVASLMEQSLSFSHISKTLAGISFFCRLRGFAPCTAFFSVKQALKGYKRVNFVPDDRRPISLDLLGKLCEIASSVCFSVFESILFRTAFVLAFHGALRISELIPKSKLGGSGILVDHVTVDTSGIQLWISRSKTDALGKGARIRLAAQGVKSVCPVDAVTRFLVVRPPVPGLFLVHQNGGPLTKYQFDAVLRKCLLKLGLKNMRISSHSFRIGAASEAARRGVCESDIKDMGRWKSNCFKVYVRPNLFI